MPFIAAAAIRSFGCRVVLIVSSLLQAGAAPGGSVFRGAGDASGAARLDAERFAAASDEDAVIRVYHATRGDLPESILDLSGPMNLSAKQKELDIEAAAPCGPYLIWIGSHGRKADGGPAPERRHLFATETVRDSNGVRLRVIGRSYRTLVQDLPQVTGVDWAKAAALSPKHPGGLNIEGLAGDGRNGVYIGFRSPLAQGKALILPLTNAIEVLVSNAAPAFGTPIKLELRFDGIRDMARTGDGILILGGSSSGGGGGSRLFRWVEGSSRVSPLPWLEPRGFNTEAIVAFQEPERRGILLLSDDRQSGGKQPGRGAPTFRGIWFNPPSSP